MAEGNENLVTQLEELNFDEVTSRAPDRTEATAGEQMDRMRKNLRNKIFENYGNLSGVHVIPRVDSGVIKRTNAKDGGRGFLSEYIVRELFDKNPAFDPGCGGYFVFHEHYFRSKELKGDKAVFHRAVGKSYDNDDNLSGFSKEVDFVLLHPTRGLIIAEVKAYADHNNVSGFEGIFNMCMEQCNDGFACMKAYVKHIMERNDPTGLNETDVEKLDSFFEKFSRVLIFPSLSNQILKYPKARNLVTSLAKNFRIFFKENLLQPSQMRTTIEKECFVGISDQDQQFYSLVYDISLYCCVFMTKGIRIKDFTPEERSMTRKEHLGTIKTIYLGYEQMVVRQSQDKILFVEGIAGSGKSLICWAKMFDTAESNSNRNRILYLCYNDILANKVRDLKKQRKEETGMECYDDIDVYNLMEWLRELCEKVSGKLFPRTRENFYAERLRNNTKLRQELQAKYKNVFIDEYHDLAPKTRALLQSIFMSRLQGNPSAEGCFCVFYDNLQQVTYLQEAIKNPETVIVPQNVLVHFLSTVYRTPYLVTQNFMKYVRNVTYDMGHRFLGQPVQIKCVTSQGNKQELLLDNLLNQTIEELKERHKLVDKDITVLFNSKKIRDEHRKRRPSFKCGRYSVFEFKGLENEVVIYYDPPIVTMPKEVDHRVRQHYTAGSRALWIYVLLVKSEEDKNCLEEIMKQGPYVGDGPATATSSGFKA